MKQIAKQVILLPFLLLCSIVQAQDIIILTDGSIIRSVVLEINESNILYRRFDEPDGANYRLHLDNIERINYQNGQEDIFNHKSSPEEILEESETQDNGNTGSFHMFSRIGAGLSSLKLTYPQGGQEPTKTGSYISIDIVDDNRIIYPSGFLISLPLGLGDRGWKESDSYLHATNLFIGARPGYEIKLGTLMRLDFMAGLQISYDIYGKHYDGSYSYSLSQITDYRRFDCGYNAGASLVLGKIEFYFEYRRGLMNMFKTDDLYCSSISYSFGIGWMF